MKKSLIESELPRIASYKDASKGLLLLLLLILFMIWEIKKKFNKFK